MSAGARSHGSEKRGALVCSVNWMQSGREIQCRKIIVGFMIGNQVNFYLEFS